VPAFTSESERLSWLVREIDRLSGSLEATLTARHDHHVLLVCTGLVGQASRWGSAISLLLANGLSDAVGPLQRALYELWVEFRYLMREGSPSENSRLLSINATFEAADFARKNRRRLDHASLKGITRTLRSHKAESPDLYARIVAQRRGGRFHWSGVSRTALAREFSPGGEVYRVLSWEAHVALGPIRDVEVSALPESRGRLLYRPLLSIDDGPEHAAFTTGGILYHLWNEFADAFFLPLIEEPRSVA